MKNQTKAILLIASMLSLWTTRAVDVGENWQTHCASCHGKDGKGETKAGKKANVKDLTDAKYQSTLKDESMFKAIKEGMKEGNKEKMKPFGDKLSDEEIKALVDFTKKFNK